MLPSHFHSLLTEPQHILGCSTSLQLIDLNVMQSVNAKKHLGWLDKLLTLCYFISNWFFQLNFPHSVMQMQAQVLQNEWSECEPWARGAHVGLKTSLSAGLKRAASRSQRQRFSFREALNVLCSEQTRRPVTRPDTRPESNLNQSQILSFRSCYV